MIPQKFVPVGKDTFHRREKNLCHYGGVENSTPESAEYFTVWLNHQLRMRGWSDYHLARLAGISPSVFSKARSGSLPRWDACVKIADALDLPAEYVFRQAGLLPIEDDDANGLKAALDAIYAKASERQREDILQFAMFVCSR